MVPPYGLLFLNVTSQTDSTAVHTPHKNMQKRKEREKLHFVHDISVIG